MIREEDYLHSIAYVKRLVETYEKECIDRDGSSSVKLVDYRMKSAESIAKKLERKGYAVSGRNAKKYLNDLAGVRVVCVSVEDIYRLRGFLGKDEGIQIVKEKDYIKMPKENGYQSLHLIMETEGQCPDSEKVRLEVQMRTEEMHRWAQRDHKLYYKNG